MKTKREYVITVQRALAATSVFLSAKLGTLYPMLCTLIDTMVLDYITGMSANRNEAIDHPGDTSYGWSSRKGAKGIIKKAGYLRTIAAAVVIDYVTVFVLAELGMQVPVRAFFGFLMAVWYLLNELLSTIENAGRMGANVSERLRKYIVISKDKIDNIDYQGGSKI